MNHAWAMMSIIEESRTPGIAELYVLGLTVILKCAKFFGSPNHASFAFLCHKISAHDGWLMHNIKIFWFLLTYGIKKIVCVVYSTDMEESDVRSLHELGIQKPSTGKLLAKLLFIIWYKMLSFDI